MSFDPGDGEPVAAYQFHVRKARKAHTCTACNLGIKAGQRYAYVTFICEGERVQIKRCGVCEKVYRHVSELARKEGFCADMNLDCGMDYEEEWGSPPPEIERLAFATSEEAAALLESSDDG